jgi:hypothetical protein
MQYAEQHKPMFFLHPTNNLPIKLFLHSWPALFSSNEAASEMEMST